MTDMHVIWWARHPGTPCRGYWDQGDLERIFDGRWPHATPMPRVVHHEVTGDAPMPGPFDQAVVIVPGRYHYEPEWVERLQDDIATSIRDYTVLIVCGDEERLFSWDGFVSEECGCKVWVMTPAVYDELAVPAAMIGEGSPPGIDDVLAGTSGLDREFAWGYAGQITHERRQQAELAMRGMVTSWDAGADGHADSTLGRCWYLGTEGFTQGMDQDQYWRFLARTKVAPCPAGPETASSFRVWEALEAGCVPIVDARPPGGTPGYWDRVLGPHHPLPVIDDWATLPTVIGQVLDDWALNAATVSAWWQQHKWELATYLHIDGARRVEPQVVGEDITVLVTTSPTSTVPSTKLIEETVDSVRGYPELADSQLWVLADGIRGEQAHLAGDYHEFRRRLTWLTNHRWGNAVPWLHPQHVHQANLLREALTRVTTPMVLVLEHDTPLVGDIDWTGLAAWVLLDSGPLDLVRLYHEGRVPAEHRHLMLDHEPVQRSGWAPVIRTAQWSQRPHLARTSWYRSLLDRYFAPESRTFVEDVMHGVVDQAWRERGEAGLEQFRLGIYHPLNGPDLRRSGHSDGRGSDPKYDLVFEYPGGDTPDGAPRATSQRVD